VTWFKVDDSFHSHPKALAAGPAAVGLWTIAGSWSSANLTDGFVPDYLLPRLGQDAQELARTLVTVGLWRRAKGGHRFHDWDDYQRSREEVLEGRQKWAEKKASQRAAKAAQEGRPGRNVPSTENLKTGSQESDNDSEGVTYGHHEKRAKGQRRSSEGPMSPGDTPGDSPGEYPGESRSSRTRTRTSSKEEVDQDASHPSLSAIEDRSDVERVCTHLADRIVDNGSKRPTITKAWRNAARLMIDRDGRTEQQIHTCIDWCQGDEFWRRNVMSMPKLREQYDRLRLAAQERRASGGGVVRRSTTDERVEQAQALKAELRNGSTLNLIRGELT
jgi:hypothetical protein